MSATTAAYIAAAVIAAGTAVEQRRQSKIARENEEDAAATAKAEQEAQRQQQTRQQIREERIKRAQIIQASQNTGVGQSSGQLGATGAMQTQLASNIASATRSANSANAITGYQQNAADAMSRSQEVGAIGSFAQQVVGAGASLYSANATATPTSTTQVGGQSPATQPNPYDVNNIFR